MPRGGFRWLENIDNVEALHADLANVNETPSVGRFYQVTVSCPPELQNQFNDLPFLYCNNIPPGSKIRKLIATFLRKERYVVHIMNLKQAIAHGLILEKVRYYYYYYRNRTCNNIFYRFIRFWNSNNQRG